MSFIGVEQVSGIRRSYKYITVNLQTLAFHYDPWGCLQLVVLNVNVCYKRSNYCPAYV